MNVIENSSKKKKVELLFMLPPTPNHQRVFNSAHQSKSNSANNSVVSQRNMRYSQKSEDEDDQYYGYEKLNLETSKDLSQSSEQKILIKPKLSLGPIIGPRDRESLFSNRSTSNGRRNRYDDSPVECDDLAAPFTVKNEMKSSLLQFLHDEVQATQQASDSLEESKKSPGKKQITRENHHFKHEEKKKSKKQLNKYLSSNNANSSAPSISKRNKSLSSS